MYFLHIMKKVVMVLIVKFHMKTKFCGQIKIKKLKKSDIFFICRIHWA